MKDCNEIVECIGRREFLVKSALTAGGILLTISGAARAAASLDRFAEVTLEIDDKSPLSKIGGSTVVDSTAGKLIVVRTGETSFAAFSALCTHKGAPLNYDSARKQFICPKHDSIFDGTTGKVLDGPADEPLPSYPAKGTSNSVTVTVGS